MNRLQEIARAMKSELADAEGWVQRALFGGLLLVLERRDQTWRLALGRTKAPPSKTETAVCEEAFGLVGVEWSWHVRRKGKETYHVAETTWVDVTPMARGAE